MNEPCTSDELDDGAEEEEGAVEREPSHLPVRAQQPIQDFEPLVNAKSRLLEKKKGNIILGVHSCLIRVCAKQMHAYRIAVLLHRYGTGQVHTEDHAKEAPLG